MLFHDLSAPCSYKVRLVVSLFSLSRYSVLRERVGVRVLRPELPVKTLTPALSRSTGRGRADFGHLKPDCVSEGRAALPPVRAAPQMNVASRPYHDEQPPAPVI